MAIDFIQFDGSQMAGNGQLADRLLEYGGDPNILRPYVGKNGKTYITQNRYNPKTGKVGPVAVPVTNAPATLRKDDWLHIDRAIIRAARPRLKAWAGLRAMGNEYMVPNGLGKMLLEFEKMSDISRATTSMDGMRQSEEDRPVFELGALPLPIIHKDFSYHIRQILASRNGGSPLDTATAELAAEKVAEEVERYTIGSNPVYSFGGASIYGYTNFPHRITHSITAPDSVGWEPGDLVDEVLAMMQKSVDAMHYGPWSLYLSTNWMKYLGQDYILTGGNVATQTLRQRLQALENIQSVEMLDYLTGWQVVLVQRSPNVARAVVGAEMMTIQWDTHGGMRKHFKVMAILVPQLRADINGNTGIVHGS